MTDAYILDIDSARLRAMAGSYIKVGRGDHHVIALHGWFGSALGWGHLPEYLNTTAFSYVFPDLRGYGSRRDEAGEFTMAEAAADAIGLADALGWAGTTRRTAVGVGAYASTKTAVNMLSAVLRQELADDGIAVSLLLPSITAPVGELRSQPAYGAARARTSASRRFTWSGWANGIGSPPVAGSTPRSASR